MPPPGMLLPRDDLQGIQWAKQSCKGCNVPLQPLLNNELQWLIGNESAQNWVLEKSPSKLCEGRQHRSSARAGDDQEWIGMRRCSTQERRMWMKQPRPGGASSPRWQHPGTLSLAKGNGNLMQTVQILPRCNHPLPPPPLPHAPGSAPGLGETSRCWQVGKQRFASLLALCTMLLQNCFLNVSN